MHNDDPAGFPRQNARTRRFTLGVPRDLAVSPDGRRVLFLRSRSGDDPLTSLWHLDVESGTEELLADAATLATDDAALPAEERARRERAREASSGIVRFTTDRAVTRASFDVAGSVHIADLQTRAVHRLETAGPAVDARLDPTGRRVAHVVSGALHVVDIDGSNRRTLLEPESSDISYGLSEFVAAEEMGRQEGSWWSPDGTRLLVARVDIAPVQRWYIADPADPASVPLQVAYPVAGSDNARVSLVLCALDGARTDVAWDSGEFEYLVTARWDEHALLVVVQPRDQRRLRILSVDPGDGSTSLLHEDSDETWVDIVDGVPAHLADGTLVRSADQGGAKRLMVADEAVTTAEMEVRAVLDVDGDTVLFSASHEPTEIGVFTWSRAQGVRSVSGDAPLGVCSARRAGGTTVLLHRDREALTVEVSVQREGMRRLAIASCAETPVVAPRPLYLRLGERQLRAALLFPTGHEPGSGPLPVLLDPYGGPGHQKVLATAGAHLESQWFADRGFAVLVVDGRGTPGRGPGWARSIRGDGSAKVLEDQVDALRAAAAEFSDLDLTRVGIRGWSYGGYLAALAVLRRPDVFHAGVAGAPVTDYRLYDTHYTERYLGHPQQEPENYEAMSLLGDAAALQRPLLIIHGLSDDNVVVANSLRLSATLFAAGRPHTMLPLPGVTHSTNRAEVAVSLPLLQLEFLQRALGTG